MEIYYIFILLNINISTYFIFSHQIRVELCRNAIEIARDNILKKQTECLEFLKFEKENELIKSENNHALNKRHIETKFNSRLRVVQDHASSELKVLDTHGQKLRELERRTDTFQKRMEMLSVNGKGLLCPSFEASLNKEGNSLCKEWNNVLALKVPDVFDIKLGMSRGVLRVTCTSSNGISVFPDNAKKTKRHKRRKTTKR